MPPLFIADFCNKRCIKKAKIKSVLPRSAPEDGHPKDKEQGISSANIPKLPGHGTCSANEALTIKRAASSAVGLFPGGVPTTRMSMISICTSNATRAPDRGVKTAKNGRKEGRKEEECAWDTNRKCVHSAGKRCAHFRRLTSRPFNENALIFLHESWRSQNALG